MYICGFAGIKRACRTCSKATASSSKFKPFVCSDDKIVVHASSEPVEMVRDRSSKNNIVAVPVHRGYNIRG